MLYDIYLILKECLKDTAKDFNESFTEILKQNICRHTYACSHCEKCGRKKPKQLHRWTGWKFKFPFYATTTIVIVYIFYKSISYIF